MGILFECCPVPGAGTAATSGSFCGSCRHIKLQPVSLYLLPCPSLTPAETHSTFTRQDPKCLRLLRPSLGVQVRLWTVHLEDGQAVLSGGRTLEVESSIP